MANTADNIKSASPTGYAPLTFSLLIFCQTLFVFCLFKANPFGDPDSLWHLAAGDEIRALGRLPVTDSWSFTADGTLWYNLSWLWDTAASMLYGIGGFGALYSATLIIYSLAIALQAHYAFTRGAKPQMVILTCYIAACLTLAGLFFRPGMMSALFGVCFYLCLSRYRETKNRRGLIALPLIMILWVNMHGGFLLAFVLFGVFAAEAIWQNERSRLGMFILFAAACGAATLINPYGIHIYEGAMRTLGSPLQNVINEWLPLDASSPRQKLMLIAVLLVVAFGQFSNSSIAFADRLLSIVLVAAVVTSVRHILLMAVLIIPYLSYCLYSPARSHEWQEKQNRIAQNMTRDFSRRAYLIGTICISLLLITYTLTPMPRDKWLGAPAGPLEKNLLAPEIAFIEANYPNTRFMNYYDLGGELIFGARGKVPVFVDGREQTAYPHQLIKDTIYLNKWQGWDAQSQRLMDNYKIGGIIMPNGSSNTNPRFKEVFKGPGATILVRRDAP